MFLAYPASAGAQEKLFRLGVLCVGQETVSTGQLQRSLEAGLGRPPVAVTPAEAIAQLLRGPNVRPTTDLGARRAWLRLLEQATQSYFEDRLSDAQVQLAQAQRLQGDRVVPAEDRVRLFLLQSAVYLGVGDTAAAKSRARAALTLNPDLTITENDYPPSLVRIFTDVRKQLQFHTVELTGMPPGAIITLDDRGVSSRFKASEGPHRIIVTAPGFKYVTLTLQVRGDQRVSLPPPISLSRKLDGALSRMLWSSAPVTRDDLNLLSRLAQQLGVDAVLIAGVIPFTETGGLLWSSQNPTAGTRIRVRGDKPQQWSEIAGKFSAELAKRPNNKIDTVGPPPRKPSAWDVKSDGGLALAFSTRNVRGGDEFDAGFFGQGAHGFVRGTRGNWVGQARLLLLTFDLTPSTFNLPGGGEARKGGGTYFHLRGGAGAGYTLTVAETPVRLEATALPWWEILSATDLQDNITGGLGLLASQQSLGVDLGVSARVPVGGFEATADVALTTFGARRERPGGITGDDPSIDVALSGRVGVAGGREGPWQWRVWLERQTRNVKFDGSAIAPVNPPVTDAKVTEAVTFLSFGVQRVF